MINYKEIDKSELPLIKDLWLNNANFHSKISLHFNNVYDESMFLKRIKAWQSKEQIKIHIAEFQSTIVGYCISSIDKNCGEIESLHVAADYRRKKIGKTLAKKHIQWFENNSCEKVEVFTVYKNERALNFYKSLGIYPQSIKMRLK